MCLKNLGRPDFAKASPDVGLKKKKFVGKSTPGTINKIDLGNFPP